eukprot:4031094-Pyramimonas_sp.AAC.1
MSPARRWFSAPRAPSPRGSGSPPPPPPPPAVRWALFRYMHHRKSAFDKALSAARPFRLLRLSCQLKWGEAQQQVTCYMSDCESPMLQQTMQ